MREISGVRAAACRLLGVLPRGDRSWNRTIEITVIEGEERADGAILALRFSREEARRLMTELKRVFR